MPILDKYGKPMKSNSLRKVYNPGPGYGISGLFNFGGQFLNPDQIDIRTYEKMLEADETCSSGIEFITLAVISRLGEYTNKNTKIAEFVKEQFERISGSLVFVIEELLSALWAGYSVGEMVFDFDGGAINLADVQFLHPSLVVFNLHTDENGDGNSKGNAGTSNYYLKNRIKDVQIYGGITQESIPFEKLMVFSHRSRFGNPYGISRFKPIYPVYYFKNEMLSGWAKTLERYGSPPAIAYIPLTGADVTDQNNKEMGELEYWNRTMNSLQNGTNIAVDNQAKIEVLQYARALGSDFQTAIDYCNKMIYRGLLLPSLLESNAGGGAYALGKVHFDMWTLSLDKLLLDISEVLLEQCVRRLIEWNFGAQDNWGSFGVHDFDPEVAKLMSEIFTQAVNNGSISPDRYPDMEYMREKLGFPGIPEAEWKQEQEEKEKRRLEVEERLRQKADAESDDGNQRQEAGGKGQGQELKDETIKKPEKVEKPDRVKMSALLNGVSSFFLWRVNE